MAVGEKMGPRPQGCFIKLYYDDKEEPYEPHNIHYMLHPTGVAWEIFALLEHMAKDDNVKVALWTGSGQAFNSGADLKNDPLLTIPEHIRMKMLARGMGKVAGDMVLKEQTLAFWDFPKPSIVAVNGLAVGGAANIALANHHDLVICSTNARFMFPFAKLGFTPELGSSYVLPYIIGMAKAKEIFYLGEWFTAEQAHALGLANMVVAPDQLMPEALRLAERLCLLHPAALSNSKRILNHHIRKQLGDILDEEQRVIMKSLNTTKGPPAVAKWMRDKEEWMRQIKARL